MSEMSFFLKTIMGVCLSKNYAKLQYKTDLTDLDNVNTWNDMLSTNKFLEIILIESPRFDCKKDFNRAGQKLMGSSSFAVETTPSTLRSHLGCLNNDIVLPSHQSGRTGIVYCIPSLLVLYNNYSLQCRDWYLYVIRFIYVNITRI